MLNHKHRHPLQFCPLPTKCILCGGDRVPDARRTLLVKGGQQKGVAVNKNAYGTVGGGKTFVVVLVASGSAMLQGRVCAHPAELDSGQSEWVFLKWVY